MSPSAPRGREALALGLLALVACSAPAPRDEDPPAVAGTDVATSAPTPPPRGAWFPFTVRGRWEDPRALTWTLDPSDGALSGRQTERAIEDAIALWRAAAPVDLVRAPAGTAADVELSWQRKGHGDARPFGVDLSVAHSGPVEPGTFVHFDASRTWVERHADPAAPSMTEESLLGAAVHELGHVFGLGHSPDSRAALYMDSRAEAPHASDLAGLHSLYGGGEDAPGDLAVLGPHGARSATLRRVAPPAFTDWDLFDANGDGADEVLVWRTDADGHGALLELHFEPGPDGPRLARTSGPYVSPLLGAATNVGLRVEEDERLVTLTLPDGQTVACPFGSEGQPGPPRAFAGEVMPRRRPSERTGDLDGDGREETVRALDG